MRNQHIWVRLERNSHFEKALKLALTNIWLSFVSCLISFCRSNSISNLTESAVGDSSVVATACEDGTIGVWRDERGSSKQKPHIFEAHADECLRLLWDQAHEKRLYSGGAEGIVKVWEASPEGASLLGEANCVDQTHREGNDGQVYGIIQFKDRQELAVAFDDQVTIMDKERFQDLLTWKYHTQGAAQVGGSRNPHNKAFVFDTDVFESTLVTGLSDGTVRCRDIRAPLYDRLCVTDAHDTHVTCCAISSSGFYLLSGSGGGEAALWDLRTLQPVWRKMVNETRPGPFFGASFWPDRDDLALMWSSNGEISFHNVETEATRRYAPDFHDRSNGADEGPYPIFSASFSPSGTRVVLCGGTTPAAPRPQPAMSHRPKKSKTGRGTSNRGYSFGLRAAPSLGQGAMPVHENLRASNVPWISLRLSAENVLSLFQDKTTTALGSEQQETTTS